MDLHAITVRQDPATLRRNTLNAYALLLAAGWTRRSLSFIQSHVPARMRSLPDPRLLHAVRELSRMTQFKDKSAKHADNVNAGLFTYLR